jgi:hypothetical protein
MRDDFWTGAGSSLSEEVDDGGPGRSGRFFGGEGVWNSNLTESNEFFRGGVAGKLNAELSASGVAGPSDGVERGGEGGDAMIF